MFDTKLVDEWLRLDQNESTRAEIKALVAENNGAELADRLRSRIEFGTAGLRGRMEAGFSRMNDLTVIQASQVGRRSSRPIRAMMTHLVFLQGSMVPFSVGRLNAACGVMITASHNPKTDNGYKVYWENAVQIIGPHDKGIARSILDNLEPSISAWDVRGVLESSLCHDKTQELVEAYFVQLLKLSRTRTLNPRADVKFVSTAMHGVGHRFAARAFEVFGLKPFFPVESQKDPDPEFPTVIFPNPEEKGALDLALAEADKQGALYVLAQDPDADRFAAAERQQVSAFRPVRHVDVANAL
ncbi:Phosphoglucomutase-3 [Tulasnella sp. 332]|nr:Phosphoglucomutase-3 [Tulasnella sp. 332]